MREVFVKELKKIKGDILNYFEHYEWALENDMSLTITDTCCMLIQKLCYKKYRFELADDKYWQEQDIIDELLGE